MALTRNFQMINWDTAHAKIKEHKLAMSKPIEWLNIEEVCRRYSTSRSNIHRMRKEGRIPEPSYHLGSRSPRWNAEALDRMMNKGKYQEHE